jgi:NAD(P)-dependent dehydrogenase (short-subunit alcohol dehydrogenase family)
VLSLTRTLSGELLSRGIRVNAVSPGPITTPLYGKFGAIGVVFAMTITVAQRSVHGTS